HARTAVPGQVHAEQAHLPQFRCKLAGEHPGLEPVGDVRHHLLRGVGPHGVPDQALLRGELVLDLEYVEAWPLGRGGRWHGESSRCATRQRMPWQLACAAGPGATWPSWPWRRPAPAIDGLEARPGRALG